MESHPANVNFGNPNASPTNFLYFDSQTQNKNEKNECQNNDKNCIKPTSLNDKIISFLNKNTITILTIAIAVAIGLGIRDLINSLVMNVLQPSLMVLIMTIDKNDFLPITKTLRDKNPEANIDISKLLGSVLALKLIVGTTYLMYIYMNIFSPVKII